MCSLVVSLSAPSTPEWVHDALLPLYFRVFDLAWLGERVTALVRLRRLDASRPLVILPSVYFFSLHRQYARLAVPLAVLFNLVYGQDMICSPRDALSVCPTLRVE